MEKNYIVYSAGEMGVTIKRYSKELGLSVIGFFDNNKNLQGKFIDGVKVLTQDEVCRIIEQDNNIGFIIGSETYLKELLCEIRMRYGNKIEVIEPDGIQKRYWEEIALPQRKQLREKYVVDYNVQISIWTDNIMSEIEYWIKSNAAVNAINYSIYTARYNHQEDEFWSGHLHKELHPGDVVLDVGCGICTPYGKCIESGKLNLTAIDPLAYFYNKINEIAMKNGEEKVKFGLMEFLSVFCKRDFADVILVDNAMDHCIDPFKSILECLVVLKTGGVLSMKHRRCEAVYEGYAGLHRWNIDVNDENEFIIWNKENFINVSRAVENFAEVKVCLKNTGKRKDEFIEIEIEKENVFDMNAFYSREEENQRMGKVIQALMMKLSDRNINQQFQRLLEML